MQFFFVDAVGNQSPLIRVYVDLTFGVFTSSTGLIDSAHIINATPTDFASIVPTLVAGDVLVLAPGTYPSTTFSGLNGTEDQPIIIVSQDRTNRARFASAAAFLVSIANSSHLIFRHLTFDGQNHDDSDGIRTAAGATTSHHITIENCDFYSFQGTNQVAINTKATALNWAIISNRFTTASTAMSLGSSTKPFLNGLVESNFVNEVTEYALHIPGHATRPTNDGIPIAQTKNVVRNNTFVKAASGSYPLISLGGQPSTGFGANDYNEVYANFLYENTADAAFIQATGRVSIHHNIIAKGSNTNTNNVGIKLLDLEGFALRVAHVFQNTVVGAYVGIRQVNEASTESRLVANLVFSNFSQIDTPPESAAIKSENITDLLDNASLYISNGNVSTTALFDPYPKPGMASSSAANLTFFKTNAYFMSSTIDYDFNGYTNLNTFRGAYSGEGTNLGWKLARNIKSGGAFPTVGDIEGPPPLILASNVTGAADTDLDPALIACPSTQASGSVYRICNSEDTRAVCQGPNVLKPQFNNANTWTTTFQNWLDNRSDGDVIEVVYSATATNDLDPGRTRNEFTGCDLDIEESHLTFRGVCGTDPLVNRPSFAYDISKCPKSKLDMGVGIFINKGDSNRFINLNFKDAKVSSTGGANAAAISDEGKNLVVAFSVFYKNNNGIVSAGPNLFNDPLRHSSVFIVNSLFEKNGSGADKSKSNGIQIGKGTSHLVVQDSLLLRQQEKGNELESSAQQTTVQCSVISGRDPYGSNDTERRNWQDDALLSFPIGGKVQLTYNSIYKGSNPTNGYQFIYFNTKNSEPANLNYYQDLSINNNYIHNRMTGTVPAFFLNYNQRDAGRYTAKTSLSIRNNLFHAFGNSYEKKAIFNLLGGLDLSFDITDYGNDLLYAAVLPTAIDVQQGAQFVATPGNDAAAVAAEALQPGDGELSARAHCPNFKWIRRP